MRPDAPVPRDEARVEEQIIAPRDMTAADVDRQSQEGTGKHTPVCPFCFSADTMEPFRRSSHVTLLSRIMPRLRWRYCRFCTRHFLSFLPRGRQA